METPRTIPVVIGGCHYPVIVGPGIRQRLADLRSWAPESRKTFVIADAEVFRLHGDLLAAALPAPHHLALVPPGEASKSLTTAGLLFDQLAAARIERTDLIVTFGGGVIGDLGGFVAATWMRGMRFVQVPTTLEACVDAAIGGKTGVNHATGKNLIGAFHQPSAVVMDTDFLATLSPREFAAGLAESVKHALIREPAFLTWHEQNANAILQRKPGTLTELIARNCRIKAAVVSADEREAGLRMILNYGHTIGHAIEHCLGYELRHGECVGLGLIAAGVLARERNWLSDELCERVTVLLKTFGLPTRLPRTLPAAELMAAMRMDKKHRAGTLHFVLLRDIGDVVVVPDVSNDAIDRAINALQP